MKRKQCAIKEFDFSDKVCSNQDIRHMQDLF